MWVPRTGSCHSMDQGGEECRSVWATDQIWQEREREEEMVKASEPRGLRG